MIAIVRAIFLSALALSLVACGEGADTGSNDVNALALNAKPLSSSPVAKRWMQRHQKILNQLESADPELLFIGDSIMQSWERDGVEHWEEFYADRNALNLGIDADRTETLLWRLQQYPLERISPKLSVVLIGTNNTGHRMDPADETVLGIRAVISELEARFPNTKILLLAIFPRCDDPTGAARARNDEVNTLLAETEFGERVHFRNINHMFLNTDGTFRDALTIDGLHLSDQGYLVWASTMSADIELLLSD